MKAQILKIAGVKDEKSFYKKFPTEEAFMKKHGKAFKKACGGSVKKAPQGISMQQIPSMGMPDFFPNLDTSTLATKKAGMDWGNVMNQGIPIVGDLIQGVSDLFGEKKEMYEALKWQGVSDVVRQASSVGNFL